MKRLFPSLPETPQLSDVFRRFPATLRPLLEYHELVLRGDSALTVGERELIAAFVSGLNACVFCHGAHTLMARAFGIDPGLIEALLEDPATAPVEERLRPVLAYVEKLTRSPTRLTEADAAAVYAAGWSEEALFDAIQTCAIFNMMNRIVEGTGVTTYPADPATVPDAEVAPLRRRGYLDIGRQLGVIS